MQCPAFVPQAVSIHLPIDSLFTKERQGLATAAGGPESPGCHPRLCGMNSDGTSQGSLDHGEQETLLGSDPVAIETSDGCSSQIWGWALREDFFFNCLFGWLWFGLGFFFSSELFIVY